MVEILGVLEDGLQEQGVLRQPLHRPHQDIHQAQPVAVALGLAPLNIIILGLAPLNMVRVTLGLTLLNIVTVALGLAPLNIKTLGLAQLNIII